MGGDFLLYLIKVCFPTVDKLTNILPSRWNNHPFPALTLPPTHTRGLHWLLHERLSFQPKKGGGISKCHYNELVMILLINTLLRKYFMYFFIDNVCLVKAYHVIHSSPSIKLSPFKTFTDLLSPLDVKCLLALYIVFASHFDFSSRQPCIP